MRVIGPLLLTSSLMDIDKIPKLLSTWSILETYPAVLMTEVHRKKV